MKISETYKTVLVMMVLLILGGFWLNFCAKLDEERMKIEYCWDSNGQYYVAPDPNCTH